MVWVGKSGDVLFLQMAVMTPFHHPLSPATEFNWTPQGHRVLHSVGCKNLHVALDHQPLVATLGKQSEMPHVQAVTNHTEESQKIKVMGVLKTFSLDILSPVKFIP